MEIKAPDYRSNILDACGNRQLQKWLKLINGYGNKSLDETRILFANKIRISSRKMEVIYEIYYS